MRLRDITIKEWRDGSYAGTLFDRSNIQLAELLLKHLDRKLITAGQAKVVIQLSPADQLPGPETRTIETVEFCAWPFHYECIESVPSGQRKIEVICAVEKAFEWLSSKYGWDFELIRGAVKACMDDDLTYEGLVWPKFRSSPSRDFGANLKYRFTDSTIDIFVVVISREQGTHWEAKIDSRPVMEAALSDFRYELRWVARDRIAIVDTAGRSMRKLGAFDIREMSFS